ncbi:MULTISPECIES: glycoside hydrolase family 43 protein [unclassified Arthrobacter]|uniref:glycoside hydrolase family 43 protein n=1 Tax=unclassified Arthrobacter TaxID=235627 RepID=UPI0009EA6C55|nr:MULTISPECIES: glycoside hydrolase family 43 protein [unclassified Arthrobacter]MDQ0826085.1 xylan 1,4-beta-xylosidase [Arthrobacter sp. B2I5]
MSSTPIIAGFYPDPSICRRDSTYYIANSSFEFAPGAPIHSSADLTTWTPLTNALDRQSQLDVRMAPPSTGVYATTLRYHGKFWLVTTNVLEYGRGQLLVSAEDPAGPWSEPVYVEGAVGIDPDLCWDENGVCHLTWVSSVPGLFGIASVPLDPQTGVMLSEPKLLWQGTGLSHPEGPHLYRLNGWWYLLLAEGGTERGHAVTVARSRTLKDAFEPAPSNPILTHRSTSATVQNTGHADLVELEDGSWAMVYLGVRPRGRSPMFHVNGRETFLAGVEWIDGWPVIDEERFTPTPPTHSFVDNFDSQKLDQRWISPNVHLQKVVSSQTPAGIRIDAPKEDEPQGMLLARARDREWIAEATIDVSAGSCRFLLRIDSAHWYGLMVSETGAEAVAAIGPSIASLGHLAIEDSRNVTLRIAVREPDENPLYPAHEPDLVELSILTAGGDEQVLATLDGRYLSTEVAGGFTGRTFGIEPTAGAIVAKRISYLTLENAGTPGRERELQASGANKA